MALYRARTTIVDRVDGRRRVVRRGETLDGADPVVAANTRYFDEVDAGVETATAAPGEKRQTSAKKRAAAKPKSG